MLSRILATKREEIAAAKREIPLSELKSGLRDLPPTRSFSNALRGDHIAVIAEIKKASPSRGVLSQQFDHIALAQEYEEGGAKALSVLTDEKYFQGRPEYINEIKKSCKLPVLRKDFIIEDYQVYESKLIGADALLLIVKVLTREDLKKLYDCARTIGLDVLVEAHSSDEIDAANGISAEIIGINNRDLTTFEVSLQRSVELRPLIRKDAITVSESGIRTRHDVQMLQNNGFHAVLVGEGLVSKNDRPSLLRELVAH